MNGGGAGEGGDLRALGTLKGLAECGLTMRKIYGEGRTDDLSAFMAYLLEETRSLHLLASLGFGRAYMKEEALQIHTLMRWADAGLPAFDLTHGLMAALLLTDPAGVGAEAVKLPFSTFAVRLPEGFWTLQGHEDEITGASVVLVHSYQAITSRSPTEARALFSFRIVGRNGRTSTWEIRDPIPDSGPIGAWIADDVPEVEDPSGAVVPPDEQDKRLAVAFRRLLVNLCLYVTAHGRGAQLGARRKPGRKRPDTGHRTPGPDVWVLGREVKLDPQLVASAKAWTESRDGRRQSREAWTLRARFTVRGHWRDQAHGPGFSLRRLTWIFPYWKGEGVSFAHVYKPDGGEGQP